MLGDDRSSTLRYMDASRVAGPAGELASADVRDADDQSIGRLDGVLIDPLERKVAFLVVEQASWFGPRRYLVPTDCPAQVCDDGRALRLELDAEQLARCGRFSRSAVPVFSDDDLMDALFRRRVA